jgi:hypothetical protein
MLVSVAIIDRRLQDAWGGGEMAAVDEVTMALREIEPQLSRPATTTVTALELLDKIKALRKLIQQYGDHWISIAKAQHYMDFDSKDQVKYWAEKGWLRSRTLENGQLKFSLDDVLRERENYEAMTAVDKDHPITPEEAMYLLRPLEYPRPASFPPLRKSDDVVR